jgi:hypothetical protein
MIKAVFLLSAFLLIGPLRELSQEMEGPQAITVHHTGPDGPRQRLMGGVEQLQEIQRNLPRTTQTAGVHADIARKLKKLGDIITEMDIVHILKAKGNDDTSIDEMGFQNDISGLENLTTKMEKLESKIPVQEFAIELGMLVAWEKHCKLTYSKQAIEDLISRKVPPDNLEFVTLFSAISESQKRRLNSPSSIEQATICFQIERSAKANGLLEPE